MCGEKRRSNRYGLTQKGSPPRVRGKEKNQSESDQKRRITPACAGKSSVHTRRSGTNGDHPRVCGEKLLEQTRHFRLLGSPPRVRGKVLLAFLLIFVGRITPACAGKRLKRSHSIGHFSYILCLFHSVLHRASASGGSRAGPCAPPCLPAQNAVPV